MKPSPLYAAKSSMICTQTTLPSDLCHACTCRRHQAGVVAQQEHEQLSAMARAKIWFARVFSTWTALAARTQEAISALHDWRRCCAAAHHLGEALGVNVEQHVLVTVEHKLVELFLCHWVLLGRRVVVRNLLLADLDVRNL